MKVEGENMEAIGGIVGLDTKFKFFKNYVRNTNNFILLSHYIGILFEFFSVKPAIFDLFLGLAIAAYLALLYLLSQVRSI